MIQQAFTQSGSGTSFYREQSANPEALPPVCPSSAHDGRKSGRNLELPTTWLLTRVAAGCSLNHRSARAFPSRGGRGHREEWFPDDLRTGGSLLAQRTRTTTTVASSV
jgi:hypothetical protein